jgi:hypothetical protein
MSSYTAAQKAYQNVLKYRDMRITAVLNFGLDLEGIVSRLIDQKSKIGNTDLVLKFTPKGNVFYISC